MVNPLSAEQTEVLRTAIESVGLTVWEPQILGCAQSAIRFAAIPEVSPETAPHFTRLGGLPDVPEGWNWPEGVEFLAQLDLKQFGPFDLNGLLPPSGLLSFFATQQLDGKESGLLCHVFHFPDTSLLKRSGAARGLVPVELTDEGDVVYRALAVNPQAHISLPSDYSSEMDKLDEGLTNDLVFNSQLADHLRSPQLIPGEYQVLGHHGFVNGGMAYVLDLSKEDLEQDEWVLLLQLDSDEERGWIFNDAGLLVFGIASQDLKNHRFDRVRCGLWSG